MLKNTDRGFSALHFLKYLVFKTVLFHISMNGRKGGKKVFRDERNCKMKRGGALEKKWKKTWVWEICKINMQEEQF